MRSVDGNSTVYTFCQYVRPSGKSLMCGSMLLNEICCTLLSLLRAFTWIYYSRTRVHKYKIRKKQRNVTKIWKMFVVNQFTRPLHRCFDMGHVFNDHTHSNRLFVSSVCHAHASGSRAYSYFPFENKIITHHKKFCPICAVMQWE